MSKRSIVYGAGAVTATVQVPGLTEGQVTFTDNGKKVGTAQIDANGTAKLVLKKPVAGNHRIAAQVEGDANLAAGPASDAATLKVVKAKPRKVAAAAKSFKKGTKPTVRMSVAKLSNGSYPTGKVTVKVGSTKKTVTLKASQKGKVSVKLGKKFSKSVKAQATFTPSDTKNVASAKAKTITVKVKR